MFRFIAFKTGRASHTVVKSLNPSVQMSTGNEALRPRVGVGVLITSSNHPGCIILGKRIGSAGSGTFALAGGHLEFGEDWCTCAVRETLEETGLHIKNTQFASVVNTFIKEKKISLHNNICKGEIDMSHSITEPQNMEPEKCEGWNWYKWKSEAFPKDLFLPLQKLKEQNYDPFHPETHGHRFSSLFSINK